MDIETVIGDLLSNFDKLEGLSKQKSDELSKVDSELADFYHKMEGIHLSHNTQAHKYIIKLQDILYRRRLIKKEIILVGAFIYTTKDSFKKVKPSIDKILSKHDKIMENNNRNKKLKKTT